MGIAHQGDIIKVEKIKPPVLVVSKDFFRETVNPRYDTLSWLLEHSNEGPLHIWTSTKEVEGYVQCEKIALLDLSVRGYKIIDSMPLSELINISDAIQGIFEYI